ncbi:MAG: efflux transporter outer membrane subunit [Methylophilaceae bacterium]
MIQNSNKRMIASLLILSLSACSTVSTETFHPENPPSQWVEPLPKVQAHEGKLEALSHWWQQFNDPVMLQLVEAAQKASPDIENAKARVVAAKSAVTIAGAQLLPSLNANASVVRTRSGQAFPTTDGIQYPTTNTASVGLDASWELDVWGKGKANKNKETANLVGAHALWHEARVIVAAQTASQYVNYRLCENLTAVAKQNADSSAETARLSELTANAGFLAPASASQSLAQAADAENLLKKQALQCTINIKGLVALTAIAEPELRNLLAQASSVMPTTAGIEVTTIPATLLAQRPDVLNAERNVAAASFEIAENEALRYPRLSLAGNINLAYDSFSRKLTSRAERSLRDSLTWSIGPLAISLPIFDGGTRQASIQTAKAQYEANKRTYESVARNAVREVEEAMATLNNAHMRLEDVNKAAEGFQISLKATETRHQANLANLFELEEARRANLIAKNNVFITQSEQTQAWISLYRAMGGGWTSAPHPSEQTLDSELNTIK